MRKRHASDGDGLCKIATSLMPALRLWLHPCGLHASRTSLDYQVKRSHKTLNELERSAGGKAIGDVGGNHQSQEPSKQENRDDVIRMKISFHGTSSRDINNWQIC